MNRADLFKAFPGGLKKAIRAYEPMEQRSIKELHDALIAFREAFDLSPWHPLTLFIKQFARGHRSGRSFQDDNLWISRTNSDAVYTSDKLEWANMLVHVHVRDNDDYVPDVHVAVCPGNKNKKVKLWSYQTEYEVLELTTIRDVSKKPSVQKLSTGWLEDRALEIIKETGNCHKPVAVHYFVGSEETVRYKYRGGRKPKRSTKEQTPTLKDVLTPDPEEHKTVRPESGIMPLDTPTPMTPIKTGALEPGDSEILVTMLEMASLKLEELGMCSTLSRWRATIRRLTQTNETDEIQTAVEAD